MTQSVQLRFPLMNSRVGQTAVESSASASASASGTGAESEAAKPLAAMLVAAVLAAVLVVADQLIETWADGHLLLIWVSLWTVFFAVLALLAPALRQLVQSMAGFVSRWSEARAQRRADDAMWRYAQTDARVMNDIQVAMTRSKSGD